MIRSPRRSSLHTLERSLGGVRATRSVRPRRAARAYDSGGAIELRYRPSAYGMEPARVPAPLLEPPAALAPVPSASVPGSVLAAPAPPPPQTSAPEPGPSAPPAADEDSYTVGDDDRAVAAAFANDLRSILESSRHDEDLGLRDADGFLEHAQANARQGEDADDDVPEEAQAQSAEPPSHGRDHSFFDRLTFATTFDAGPLEVDLSRQFDAFDAEHDRALTKAAVRRATARSKPPVITVPDRMQAIEDLALMSPPADAQTFSVRYAVPLVAQQTGMSCWAASAAMVVAWRDRQSVDPAELASASGHWAQYHAGLAPEDDTVFEVFELATEPAQTYTVQGFRELLDSYGPLWTASAVPGAHVRVVRGLEGDGTPSGTRVLLHDPWEQGMAAFRPDNRGSSYEETYAEFEAKQARLGTREQDVQGIYVAHARERLAPDDPRRAP